MPQKQMLPRAMMRGLGWVSQPFPGLGTQVALHFMTTPGRRRVAPAGTPVAERRLRTASGTVGGFDSTYDAYVYISHD